MSKDTLDRLEDIRITKWQTFGLEHAVAISNNREALRQLALGLQREGYHTEITAASRTTFSLIGQRLPEL